MITQYRLLQKALTELQPIIDSQHFKERDVNCVRWQYGRRHSWGSVLWPSGLNCCCTATMPHEHLFEFQLLHLQSTPYFPRKTSRHDNTILAWVIPSPSVPCSSPPPITTIRISLVSGFLHLSSHLPKPKRFPQHVPPPLIMKAGMANNKTPAFWSLTGKVTMGLPCLQLAEISKTRWLVVGLSLPSF